MRKRIAIIGSGTAGLQLAYALKDDFAVSIIHHRTPEEVSEGRIMSTQVHFGPTRVREERFQMPKWTTDSLLKSIHITVGDHKLFAGMLEQPALSVDQRMSYACYVEDLSRKGIDFQMKKISKEDLDQVVEEFDLVVDCTGKNGPLLPFSVDKELTPYSSPQRKCIVGYFKGVTPVSPLGVSVTVLPELGEMFEIPAVTKQGRVTILFITAVPEGPLDMFKGMETPEAFTIKMKEATELFFPEIHERIIDSEFMLCDDKAFLQIAITPEVRIPYTMINNRIVLGCGDSVILNDPITGQGSNLSSYCAQRLSDLLIDQKQAAAWDERLGQTYWQRIKPFVKEVTEWTNAMMAPLPGHVVQMLLSAANDQEKANEIARWFEYPATAHEAFYTKVK